MIKAVIADLLRMSLDDLERFDLAPASVSVVSIDADWKRVDRVNAMGPIAL